MLEHAIDAKADALQPIPKHYCITCQKCCCTGGNIIQGMLSVICCHCSFFNRRVEPDYNKCFYHSQYSPIHSVYKEPENIVEIALANEKKRTA